MKIYARNERDHAVAFDIISASDDVELPDHAHAADGESAVAVAVAAIEAANGMVVLPIAYDGCDVEGGAVVADCYVASLSRADDRGTRPTGELRFRLVYREPPVYRPGYITRSREATQALNYGQRHRSAGEVGA